MIVAEVFPEADDHEVLVWDYVDDLAKFAARQEARTLWMDI
jgi:hypothetical protein